MSGTLQPRRFQRKLNELTGPRLAASFTDGTTVDGLNHALNCGVDIAELRIDLFSQRDPDHVAQVLDRFHDVPTIATVRSADEGGQWDGDDTSRLALMRLAAAHADAIDVELSSPFCSELIVDAHANDRDVIVSFHDFDCTPDDEMLIDTISRAEAVGADFVKIATFVRTPAELQRLARLFSEDHSIGRIVIGMGELGIPSRLLFPFIGSPLTFVAAEQITAPGQLSLDHVAEIMRQLSAEFLARHPRL